jgi:hypothetical protein
MMIVLKQPRLFSSKGATEKVQFGPTLLDEVCAGCDSVSHFLFCESVWNQLRANLSISKILVNNLINLLPVNIQLILY